MEELQINKILQRLIKDDDLKNIAPMFKENSLSHKKQKQESFNLTSYVMKKSLFGSC